jgi:hypothetical protein
MASFVALTKVQYLNFVNNKATHACLFVHQMVGVLLRMKTNALINFC